MSPPRPEANPRDQFADGGGPSFTRLKSSRIGVVGNVSGPKDGEAEDEGDDEGDSD